MFNKLFRIKLLIIFSFVFSIFLVYTITTKRVTNLEKIFYEKEQTTLFNDYRINIDRYSIIANNLFRTAITQEVLLDIYNAKHSKSLDKKAYYRDNVYKAMAPHYQRLGQYGANLMLFTFSNNKVFLRVHRKDKFGDSISNVRKAVVKVNEEQKKITTFEQGKVSHAFRNIYPLFYKGEFLGSIDISFSSDKIQENMIKDHKTYSHFLVKKTIFDSKLWETKQNIIYTPSVEHKDFLFAKTTLIGNSVDYSILVPQLISNLKEHISIKMDKGEAFTLHKNLNGSVYIASFLPILNLEKSEAVAYLISYSKSDELKAVYTQYYSVNIVLFIVLLTLSYFIYIILKQRFELKDKVEEQTKSIKVQKEKLEDLVRSFDKNVIFSRTDLKGIITHVSEAFCKISQYDLKELLGKPHSIVRHIDSPKTVYKELWHSLQKDGYWEGEIKNRKKDGSFYWVYSKIEKEYDKKGNPIGYYAVREDITSKKEVEDLKHELEDINSHLEQEVVDRMKEIIELTQEIQDTQKEVVFTMGAIGESRSQETGNHVKRVAEYSKLLALHYGLSEEKAELLKQASPMHDIGKVAIPDAVLNKPGRLDEEERKIMDTHAELGFEMLKHSNRELLKIAATVAYEHHEKWDGSGYPNNLKGDEISIYGRITAVADVFDALGSNRSYKKAWELERILNLFKEEKAKHFDPEFIDIFFENLDQFLKIRDKFKD